MECVNLSDIKGNQLQYIQVFYLLTSKYKKEICLLVANNYLTWYMAFFYFPFVAVPLLWNALNVIKESIFHLREYEYGYRQGRHA